MLLLPLYWHCCKPAAPFAAHHGKVGCSIPEAFVVRGFHLEYNNNNNITHKDSCFLFNE